MRSSRRVAGVGAPFRVAQRRRKVEAIRAIGRILEDRGVLPHRGKAWQCLKRSCDASIEDGR